ncbi:hypothetical protein CA13_52020 [Planctomycetes bacterium CA13]|uniref:Uncharacterized protein n=1 Tax=Novipirellula herctigrandis TaxID=2527986 RepID=A0A5C5Z954_9BACT|nr:hypothetical protein CA13_52020 [Planctomycetes bacterium CA13]
MKLFNIQNIPQTPPLRMPARKGLSTFGVVAFLACLSGIGGFLFVARAQQLETARATEAFEYLVEVQFAQQLYQTQTGHYAANLVDLDLSKPAPAHFSIGSMELTASDSSNAHWRLTIQRAGLSPVFGDYEITFDDSGFDASRSSVETSLVSCSAQMSRCFHRMTLAKLDR